MNKSSLIKRVAMVFCGLVLSLPIFAQNRIVKGVVLDDTDQGVIGAAVMIKGTTTGVATVSWLGKFVNFYRSKYAARTPEVYFLLAEAKLRGGDTAGATAALNAVRQRANAKPFDTITIDTILDERGRELLYEEFRWATFLRMKPAEWKKRIYDHGMYSARTSADPATLYPNTRRWAEDTGEIKFNLWPIPQTYIDLNTGSDGLYQNDGWK